MSEATQETETEEAPYRRLNVVPKRICRDCVHTTQYGWLCRAGDTEVSPVTGKTSYVTACKDKNEDGECADFVAIDREAIRRKEKRKDRKGAVMALLVLLGLGTLFWKLITYGS